MKLNKVLMPHMNINIFELVPWCDGKKKFSLQSVDLDSIVFSSHTNGFKGIIEITNQLILN